MVITASDVGAVVKGTRVSLGLTQSALAERAQCSQRLISELEAGSVGVSFGRLFEVFGALGIEIRAKAVPGRGAQEVEQLADSMRRRLVSPEPESSNAPSRPLEYYLSAYDKGQR